MTGRHRREPSRRAQRPAVAAPVASLLVTALLAFVAGTFAQVTTGRPAADGDVLSVAQECQQALGYEARTAEQIAWLTLCRDSLTPPTPAPTATPTVQPTVPPTESPTPSPTTEPPIPTPTPVPTTVPPPPSPTPSPTPAPTPTPPAWPGPDNTGVPAGTALTAYTGPCRITQANTVIDAKTINCTITVASPGLVISRSRINGSVTNGSGGGGPSFGLVDSEVIAAAGNTGVGESNFTLLRVEIRGGNRSAHCYDTCIVLDSWLHGQRLGQPEQHASGLRMGANGHFAHNRLACDVADTPQDGGCSAPLTGYGDFNAVVNNLVQGNLFVATPGGTCAYGGASGGKPFSSQSGFNVDFIDNVFERGSSGRCGFYAPVLDWRRHPTNSWINNTYVGGTVIAQP